MNCNLNSTRAGFALVSPKPAGFIIFITKNKLQTIDFVF